MTVLVVTPRRVMRIILIDNSILVYKILLSITLCRIVCLANVSTVVSRLDIPVVDLSLIERIYFLFLLQFLLHTYNFLFNKRVMILYYEPVSSCLLYLTINQQTK